MAIHMTTDPLVHRGGSCPPVILGPSADETTIYRRQGGVIMPGPRPQPIILTEAQRKMLMHLARRRNSTQGLVRRARIVLAAAEGYNNEQRSPTDSGSIGKRLVCGAGYGWRTKSVLV